MNPFKCSVCGKVALYRLGERSWCGEHKDDAIRAAQNNATVMQFAQKES